MKRFLVTLSILVLLGLVVAAGYYFRYRGQENGQAGTGNGNSVGLPLPNLLTSSDPSLPAGNAGKNSKFGLASLEPAAAFYLDVQGGLLLIRPTGEIVRVSGRDKTILSGAPIGDLVRASFSPDGKKVLASFGSPFEPQTSVFDIESKTWSPLPGTLISPVWSPAEQRIAYLSSGKDAALFTLDLKDPKARPVQIFKINILDADLKWVSARQILVADKPSAFVAGSLWVIDPVQKAIKPALQDWLGLDVNWNGPYGFGLALLGGNNNKSGKLRLLDVAGNTLEDLSFLTLPEKCSFFEAAASSSPASVASGTSSSTGGKTASSSPALATPYLICAVPRDSRALTLASLPDAYLQKAIFTADDLYVVDLKDGGVNGISLEQAPTWDATDLKVFGKNLLFRNRYDDRVYWVSLPD